MAWFRKKGKYWYFVERNVDGGEVQYYIGDDKVVKAKLKLHRLRDKWKKTA